MLTGARFASIPLTLERKAASETRWACAGSAAAHEMVSVIARTRRWSSERTLSALCGTAGEISSSSVLELAENGRDYGSTVRGFEVRRFVLAEPPNPRTHER